MIEKRRSDRTTIQLHLSISNIFNQDNTAIQGLDSPIEVTDISVHGIGLVSECILPLNYYFDTTMTLGDPSVTIHPVLKIVRIDVLEKDRYMYGCEFVELSPESTAAIESYNQQIS